MLQMKKLLAFQKVLFFKRNSNSFTWCASKRCVNTHIALPLLFFSKLVKIKIKNQSPPTISCEYSKQRGRAVVGRRGEFKPKKEKIKTTFFKFVSLVADFASNDISSWWAKVFLPFSFPLLSGLGSDHYQPSKIEINPDLSALTAEKT